MIREVEPTDDRIDSRDVIAHMDDLLSLCSDPDNPEVPAVWDDDADRLTFLSLRTLVELMEGEAEYSGHVRDGMFWVSESDWVNATREWFDDTYGGDIAFARRTPYGGTEWKAARWVEVMRRAPFNHIDWEAVAAERRAPAPEIVWEGVTFICQH